MAYFEQLFAEGQQHLNFTTAKFILNLQLAPPNHARLARTCSHKGLASQPLVCRLQHQFHQAIMTTPLFSISVFKSPIFADRLRCVYIYFSHHILQQAVFFLSFYYTKIRYLRGQKFSLQLAFKAAYALFCNKSLALLPTTIARVCVAPRSNTTQNAASASSNFSLLKKKRQSCIPQHFPVWPPCRDSTLSPIRDDVIIQLEGIAFVPKCTDLPLLRLQWQLLWKMVKN